MKEIIYIASDHAGFDLKNQIINSNDNFVDLGPVNKDSVDYPDFAYNLVSKINSNISSRGILICGTGIGMAIAANRDENIRAGLAFNPEIAKLMRQHNDANVLVLPGRFMDVQEAIEIVNTFLETDFEGGRHERRVNKINK